MKKFFNIIKTSCLKDNDLSSTRVTSYIILLLIILLTLYFLSAGIYAFVAASKVVIPGELLIVYGSLLSHQLVLLGVNKNAETKQKKNKEEN